MRHPRNLPALFGALALLLTLALHTNDALANDVTIKEDESQGVKGLIATFTVAWPRDVVFDILSDVKRFPRIFPNILEARVVREGEQSMDIYFRVDAVLSEAQYTLRRTWSRSDALDIISWNRLSGDANVIRGSWALTDGSKEGTTTVTYRSYVDVSALVPTSTVRDIAMDKVNDMVVRVRGACKVHAAKLKNEEEQRAKEAAPPTEGATP